MDYKRTERVHISVSGRVQGVGYRYFIVRAAHGLSLTGIVRNMPDGSVEIESEGDRNSLEKLIAACWQGPAMSVVRDVNVDWSVATGGFKDFIITY